MNYGYWFVPYCADCTETGMTQNRAYIRTTWGGHPNHYQRELEAAQIRDFCRQKFGPEVAYVQGCAPTLNWIVRESTREQWEKAERQLWGGYPTTSLRISLAIERGGEFKIEQEEKDPAHPPKPTYEDLRRENAELRLRASQGEESAP